MPTRLAPTHFHTKFYPVTLFSRCVSCWEDYLGSISCQLEARQCRGHCSVQDIPVPCRMSPFCACSWRRTPFPRMAKKSLVSPLSQAEAGLDAPGDTPTPAICRHWRHPPPCNLQGVKEVLAGLASLGSSSLADSHGTLLPAFVYGQHHLKKGVLSTITSQT